MNNPYRYSYRYLIAATVLALSSCATSIPVAKPTAQALLGTWMVDLRPRPDAPAYLENFVIRSIDGTPFKALLRHTDF